MRYSESQAGRSSASRQQPRMLASVAAHLPPAILILVILLQHNDALSWPEADLVLILCFEVVGAVDDLHGAALARPGQSVADKRDSGQVLDGQ